MQRDGSKQGRTAGQTAFERAREWLDARLAGKRQEAAYDRAMAKRAQTRAAELGKGLLVGAMAWCFCRVPLLFSVNPLAAALLCAAEREIGWALLGLVIGLWQSANEPFLEGKAHLYAISALVAVALRLFCRLVLTPQREGEANSSEQLCRQYAARLGHGVRRIFHPIEEENARDAFAWGAELPPLLTEPVRFRVMAALLSALIPALIIPLRGEFVYYDLYGSIAYLLIIPVATALFAGAWRLRERSMDQIWRRVGVLALFWATCFCLRDVLVFHLSFAMILTIVASLYSEQRFGLGTGVVVALFGGLALGGNTLPSLLVMVVVCAWLRPVFGKVALGGAALVALLAALLVGGSTFLWEVMPSLLVGVVIFTAVERGRVAYAAAKEKQESRLERGDDQLRQLLCERARTDALCERISAVAGAFGSLSEVFRALGESLERPDANEIRGILDEIFDEHCPGCLYKGLCWSDEYEKTAEGVRALSRQLSSKPGSQVVQCLPDDLRRRCPCLIEMLEELNYRVGRQSFESHGGVEGDVFAGSYDGISHLLRDILHEDGACAPTEHRCSAEASERVARCLEEHGVHPKHVCVSGDRRLHVQIIGIRPATLTLSQEQLGELIGQVCGANFSKARYDGSEEGSLSLYSLPALRADYAHKSQPAGGGGEGMGKLHRMPCGDTLRVFEGEEGMLYALVCDGMGSGRGAALTSGPSGVFLERVLQSGVSVATALRMLNHYLRARAPDRESSSTVDLFALDLFTGKAHFIKCGAAPTLVLRQGRLYRIASHTMPLGILQAVDAQVIPYEMLPGDRVVLMSDGVTDTDTQGESDWLNDFMMAQEEREPDALVDALITAARRHGSLDDISAVCIRIDRETA